MSFDIMELLSERESEKLSKWKNWFFNCGIDIESEYIDVPKNDKKVNFEYGWKLYGMYPALINIFKYLDVFELRRAACVCKLWNDIAQFILRKRIRFSWACVILKSPSVGIQLNSPNWHWSPVSLPIIFSKTDFGFQNEAHVKNKDGVVTNWTTNAWITDCLMQTRCRPFIQIHGVCPNLLNVEEMVNVNASDIWAQFCALPKIPNVQIKVHNVYNILGEVPKQKELKAEAPKALLIFVDFLHRATPFIKDVAPKEDPTSMAFVGGEVSLIGYCKDRKVKRNRGGCAIAFYEEPNVESMFDAYSFILGNRFVNYQDILTKKKSKMKLREHSLMFKMTYNDYDSKRVKKQNKAVFRVFPNIPIYSFDIDCQLGWESSIPTEVSCDPQTKRPNFIHMRTSCYLLLTWGKLLPKQFV